MIDNKPDLRTIVRINGKFIGAAVALFYGWVCWQYTSKEWWGLGLVAILTFIGGSAALMGTTFQVVALILRNRTVERFRRQGGMARADRMASEKDLKDRGLIR